MSCVARKPVFGVSDNRVAQPHKIARGLKFRILEEELYYLCSKNKGANLHLCRLAPLFLQFSHGAAQIIYVYEMPSY